MLRPDHSEARDYRNYNENARYAMEDELWLVVGSYNKGLYRLGKLLL